VELPLRDRREAGMVLAQELSELRGRDDLIVLGLPRGGIPVAYEVALALEAPLDAYIVRKLGVPGHEELAMGAIATGNIKILNDDVIALAGVSDGAIEAVVASETRELHRRERLYRGTQPPPDVKDRTVVLVDDGLAKRASEAGRAMCPAGFHDPATRQIVVPCGVCPPMMGASLWVPATLPSFHGVPSSGRR
jgi:putative phosphoribosyl transferase